MRANAPDAGARKAAIRLLTPSPWMLVVLAGWWVWRYAALPGGPAAAGPAVLVGFLGDGLAWYAVFGWARWWRWGGTSGPSAGAWLWALSPLVLLSAVARGLDALQVRLIGERLDQRLLDVLGDGALEHALALRGLVLAVVVSAAIAMWALRKDAVLSRRLIEAHPRASTLTLYWATGAAVQALLLAVVVDAPAAMSAEFLLLRTLVAPGGVG